MLFKLSDEKILLFTTHILNLQSSTKTQNSEMSLRTFVENVSHLSITIQDFSFSISLRGGGAQTGSLTHLKHRGHNTTRRVRVTECCEDRAVSGVRRLRSLTDTSSLSPVLASTFPGAENRDRARGVGNRRGAGDNTCEDFIVFC